MKSTKQVHEAWWENVHTGKYPFTAKNIGQKARYADHAASISYTHAHVMTISYYWNELLVIDKA